MSPRAAWRLDELGYGEVYDYVAGKADWLAADLSTEGSGVHPRRVAPPGGRVGAPTARKAGPNAKARA
jgi:hypothetical protein